VYEASIKGNTETEYGSVKKKLEQEGLQCSYQQLKAREDDIGLGASYCPGDHEATTGWFSKTTQHRGKMKGLSELGVSNTHPRCSVRLSIRSSQARNTSQFRQGTTSVSLSDKDIDNCNLQMCDPESSVEPSKLWEISRRVGITCRGDEQKVVKEYSCLEVRDLEIMKSAEKGKKDVFL